MTDTAFESEEIVASELATFGLNAERFSKDERRTNGKKTPDFKVYLNGALEFFCEVKEIIDTDPLENHMGETSDGSGIAKQLLDSRSPQNRIARKIEEAVDQFSSFDPDRRHMRVLAFVNRLDGTGPDDLHELLFGEQRTVSGGAFVTTPNFLRQRIERIRANIDMYWWLERHAFEPMEPKFVMHAEGSPAFERFRTLFPIRTDA